MFPTTRLSSVVFVQLEHVGKSITKDWTQLVRRQGKASEIVVIGPVGDIAMTDELCSSNWNMWVNQLQRIGHNELEGKARQVR